MSYPTLKRQSGTNFPRFRELTATWRIACASQKPKRTFVKESRRDDYQKGCFAKRRLIAPKFYGAAQHPEGHPIVVLASARSSELAVEWRLSRSETMTAALRGGEDEEDKRASENNPSEKRFILVKTVLLAVTPGSLAGGCMCLFPRIYPREESSFGCSGGRGKLDVQRHRGAFRNLPRTFRSAESARM